MGYPPVSEIYITRDFEARQIVVSWHNDITGDQEKRFPYEQGREAMEFAAREFNRVCM